MEYFHTASLIFDDLPSMDDAEERRGHPCPHKVHGESAAILGALALINRGYALLWKVLSRLPRQRRHRAAELVESCLGSRASSTARRTTCTSPKAHAGSTRCGGWPKARRCR
ncbi:MAG: hypothetical protein HC889_10265 [Synechococcaceae cyanobacterium SM1_2_3]|nr:hypothetical protein [Synechococcaceae cyanobacterium SM1_2_3]